MSCYVFRGVVFHMIVLEAVVGGFLGMWLLRSQSIARARPIRADCSVSVFGAVVLPASYVLPRLRVPMRDVGMVAKLSIRRFMIAALCYHDLLTTSTTCS